MQRFRTSIKIPGVFERIISLGIFLCFVLNTTSSYASSSIPLFNSLKSIPKVELPQAVGIVESEKIFPLSSSVHHPHIFYLQDAHGSPQAQRNLARIIDYLVHRYGIRTIFVEGAAEKLNVQYLRFMPEVQLNQKLLNRLIDLGEITGIELALNNFKSMKGVQAIGIEDPDIYRENFQLFRKIVETDKDARKFIKRSARALDQEASRILDKDALILFRRYLEFENKNSNVFFQLELLDRMSRKLLNLDLHDSKHQVQYPNLVRLFRLKEEERHLDVMLASREWNEISKKYQVPESLKHLIEREFFSKKTMHEKTVNPRHVLEYLNRMISSDGFSFTAYPNFTCLMRNHIYQFEIAPNLLFAEMGKLFKILLNHISKNKAVRKIVREAKVFKLLSSLLTLELTRNQYEEFLKFQIPPKLNQLPLDSARRFYRKAVDREAVFQKKIENRLNTSKEEYAILITGGFHTNGLKNYFDKSRISYSVISPRFEEDQSKIYRESMTRGSKSRIENSELVLAQLAQRNNTLIRSLTREAYTARIGFIEKEAALLKASDGRSAFKVIGESKLAASLGRPFYPTKWIRAFVLGGWLLSAGCASSSSDSIHSMNGRNLGSELETVPILRGPLRTKAEVVSYLRLLLREILDPAEREHAGEFIDLLEAKGHIIFGEPKLDPSETHFERAGFELNQDGSIKSLHFRWLDHFNDDTNVASIKHEGEHKFHIPLILATQVPYRDLVARSKQLEKNLSRKPNFGDLIQDPESVRHLKKYWFFKIHEEYLAKLAGYHYLLFKVTQAGGLEKYLSRNWTQAQMAQFRLIYKELTAVLNPAGTGFDEMKMKRAILESFVRDSRSQNLAYLLLTYESIHEDRGTIIFFVVEGKPKVTILDSNKFLDWLVADEESRKEAESILSVGGRSLGQEGQEELPRFKLVRGSLKKLADGVVTVFSHVKNFFTHEISPGWAQPFLKDLAREKDTVEVLGSDGKLKTVPIKEAILESEKGHLSAYRFFLIGKQLTIRENDAKAIWLLEQKANIGIARHEINNLLNALVGYVGIILRRAEKKELILEDYDKYKRLYFKLIQEIESYQERMRRGHPTINNLVLEVKRLIELADDLIQLADRPGFDPEKSVHMSLALVEDYLRMMEKAHLGSLNDYVRFSVRSIRPRELAGVDLKVTLSQDDLRVGIQDFVFIGILNNFIRNAILNHAGRIWIKTGKNPKTGRVQLAVMNDGDLIPKKSITRIFKRGYTTRMRRKGEEAGIGLDLTERTVRFEGGKVTVESGLTQEGNRTTFTIELPVLKAASLGEDNNRRSSILVALGGNALIAEEGPLKDDRSDEAQYQNMKAMLREMLKLYRMGHGLLITHGNGPQVGDLLLDYEGKRRMSQALNRKSDAIPGLAALVEMTQEQIFERYIKRAYDEIQREEQLVLPELVLNKTRVIVDPHDVSFAKPGKPIGPYYSEIFAKMLREERGWSIEKVGVQGWQRVVASPRPVAIYDEDLRLIQQSLSEGKIVVAVGGGGIPVYVNQDDKVEKLDGVIDKDRSSALLANSLKLDNMLIVTNGDRVKIGYDTYFETALSNPSLKELERHLDRGEFPEGNMGPKVEAMIHFIKNGGKLTVMTSKKNIVGVFKQNQPTFLLRVFREPILEVFLVRPLNRILFWIQCILFEFLVDMKEPRHPLLDIYEPGTRLVASSQMAPREIGAKSLGIEQETQNLKLELEIELDDEILEARHEDDMIIVSDRVTRDIVDHRDLKIWPGAARRLGISLEPFSLKEEDVWEYLLLPLGVKKPQLKDKDVSVLLTQEFIEGAHDNIALDVIEALTDRNQLALVLKHSQKLDVHTRFGKRLQEIYRLARLRKIVPVPFYLEARKQVHEDIRGWLSNRQGFSLEPIGGSQDLVLDAQLQQVFSQIAFDERELSDRTFDRNLIFNVLVHAALLPHATRIRVYQALGLAHRGKLWVVGANVVDTLEKLENYMKRSQLQAVAA